MAEIVRNRRLCDDEFEAMRVRVLSEWPTGADVDLTEAAAFHRQLPPSQNLSHRLAGAEERGEILLQPRAGVGTLEGQIELLRFLQDEGGADVLPTQVDSYTRTKNFAKATAGIDKSHELGRSVLNGFPIVSYGVKETRKLTEALHVPLELRAGAPDLRLVSEIAFASGFSGFTVGPLYYTVHYSKSVPFEQSIPYWQYIFRLMGRYEEQGVPILASVHGIGGSIIFPPSLTIVGVVAEALLAAEQGVKHMTIDTRIHGHLVQDVAGARVVRRLCRKYLDRFGYTDVQCYPLTKTWCGKYPEDEASAYGLTSATAVTAVLSGAREIVIKSIEEAIGVPTKEANARSLRATRQVVNIFKVQSVPLDEVRVRVEEEVIEAEARAILERVLELGEGDLAAGIITAFAAGVVDVPFAASRCCQGRLMIVRDAEGAVRFLDHGLLPLPQDVLDYHRSKLAERERLRGAPLDYQTVVDDLFSLSQGYLVNN